ncbi:hypothetical protein WISP_73980 [Willisornis vidua]|uniref:Uncharacterized protein n=1 Tax=Willisornis vidua TaxID=1566151 RepID=A0ABQ9DBG8_9PASS|nr:hypothetical protein WISP_73980 [Willisornis vidua]
MLILLLFLSQGVYRPYSKFHRSLKVGTKFVLVNNAEKVWAEQIWKKNHRNKSEDRPTGWVPSPFPPDATPEKKHGKDQTKTSFTEADWVEEGPNIPARSADPCPRNGYSSALHRGYRDGSCEKLAGSSSQSGGSKVDLPLAKAKPISGGGSTSGITELRRGKVTVQEQLQWDRGVRICERNSSADTKVSGEEGRDAPGAGAEIPLQAMVNIMVKQLCPCRPWTITEEQISPAARGGLQSSGMFKESFETCEKLMLEQVRGSTCDPLGTHVGAVCS